MQKATKVLIILFLIFVISIFYISLNRDTSYNTSSLINKELPEFEISFFNEKKFYKNNDLKKIMIKNNLREGANNNPAEFVLEKAFVD